MSIERFKVDVRKAIASLLPFAQENKLLGPEDLMKEIREHGLLKSERVYVFLPYKVALTIDERDGRDFPMFSVSVWVSAGKTRPLDEDEKKEVVSAMEEAFPDHRIDMIDGGFLGNPPPFKVVGIPKDLAESEGMI